MVLSPCPPTTFALVMVEGRLLSCSGVGRACVKVGDNGVVRSVQTKAMRLGCQSGGDGSGGVD